METATIPGARDVKTRHPSVPGPRIIEARGIPVVYGEAGANNGEVRLRDSSGEFVTDRENTHGHVLMVDVQKRPSGRGVLNRLCIPRESIEAFVDATRRDPGRHRISRAAALMREALEDLPEEFIGDEIMWLEQALALANRCEGVEILEGEES